MLIFKTSAFRNADGRRLAQYQFLLLIAKSQSYLCYYNFTLYFFISSFLHRLLIQFKQAGYTIAFGEVAAHGESVGFHHSTVVLLMGTA